MSSGKYSSGNEFQSQVNDAVASYIRTTDVPFSNYSFDKSVNTFQDPFLMHLLIQEGLAFKIFKKVSQGTPFTDDQWAGLLHISRRTLERHREQNKPFKSLQTDRILEVADVIQQGLNVFNDEEKFYRWLFARSVPLGNESPFELIKNSYGKQLVVDELYRIDYGIFA